MHPITCILAILCVFIGYNTASPLSAMDMYLRMVRSRGPVEKKDEWASRDFVRPIGTLAGEPIYPRRFESNKGVHSYMFDENGIAFAMRERPSLEQIIRGPKGTGGGSRHSSADFGGDFPFFLE